MNRVGYTALTTLIYSSIAFSMVGSLPDTSLTTSEGQVCGDTSQVDFDPERGVDKIEGESDLYVAYSTDGIPYLIEGNRAYFANSSVKLTDGNYDTEEQEYGEFQSWEMRSRLKGGDGKTRPWDEGSIGSYNGGFCK